MPDIPIPESTRPLRTSWFPKFAESTFVAIAFFNLGMDLIQFMPLGLPLGLHRLILGFSLAGQVFIGFIFGIVYSLIWHSRERRNAIRSTSLHAWFQAILRYWLAFEISLYGFGKIFRTQFGPSFSRNDTPIGQLNGFELTWNYFGHSYPFALIIAGLQIGGSILLLFRRTTLLGAAVLFPVMINIFLINVFFHIAFGAFLNSIFFSLGLIYLLYLCREELIRLFFHSANYLPALGPGWLKQLARLGAIGGAFTILFLAARNHPDSPLEGKWTVDQLIRNRDTVGKDAWLTNPGAWRSVYIERFNQLHLCPNPYIFDRSRSLDATFHFDPSKHEIRLFFTGPHGTSGDTVTEAVSNYDASRMNWEGILGGDTVKLRLTRVTE